MWSVFFLQNFPPFSLLWCVHHYGPDKYPAYPNKPKIVRKVRAQDCKAQPNVSAQQLISLKLQMLTKLSKQCLLKHNCDNNICKRVNVQCDGLPISRKCHCASSQRIERGDVQSINSITQLSLTTVMTNLVKSIWIHRYISVSIFAVDLWIVYKCTMCSVSHLSRNSPSH